MSVSTKNITKLTSDAAIYELRGLSTDEKPTAGYIGDNSTFLEMDTGKTYYFDKGAWKEMPTTAQTSGGGAGSTAENVVILDATANPTEDGDSVTWTTEKTAGEIFALAKQGACLILHGIAEIEQDGEEEGQTVTIEIAINGSLSFVYSMTSGEHTTYMAGFLFGSDHFIGGANAPEDPLVFVSDS